MVVAMPETELAAVAELDRATADGAAELLRPCCASARWVERLVTSRPRGSLPQLVAASDAAIADLTWPDIEEALAAHPRIGEPARGGGRESAWSRQEQAGATRATEATGARPRWPPGTASTRTASGTSS